MKARLLSLVLGAALLSAGCASSATDDADQNDGALRAMTKDDVSQELLSTTPALSPPEKFAKIASWSVDYVEMNDPNPDNAYRGVMVIAQDADGAPVYFLPVGYSGTDAQAELGTQSARPTAILFDATPDASGSLSPVKFTVGEGTDADVIASEKASMAWLSSEEQRLIGMIKPSGDSNIRMLAVNARDAIECGAHVAALIFATNPLLYFVVDGAIDIAAGFYDSMNGGKDVKQEIAVGVVKEGFAGIGKGIQKVAGEKGVRGALYAGIAINVGLNLYDANGDVVAAVKQTALDLIPPSCRRTYDEITSK